VIFHDTIACPGVERVWINAIRRHILEPVYEFVAESRPMGIGVAILPTH
jgi:hypothetical protein